MKKLIIIFSLILTLKSNLSHGASSVVKSKFCEFYSAKPECDPQAKYRSFNGFCNNLFNPKWGAEYNVQERILKARYQDDTFQVVESVKSGPLPSARKLSVKLFSNQNETSGTHSLILAHFGQLLVEDTASNADVLIPRKCCDVNGNLDPEPRDPMCLYIPIDSEDPTYADQPRQCMKFIRATSDLSSKCRGFHKNGPANPLNAVTAYIDLSNIYGTNINDHRNLRKYKDGLLSMVTIHGAEYPKFMTKENAGYSGDEAVGKYFLTGDVRMNRNPQVAVLNILFMREHNRLARELRHLNPHWNDEKLFQEARRINIAQTQYIVYHHFYAELLGKWYMRKNLLIFHDNGDERVDDYDPNVNANIISEYSTAALRYFHTIIQGETNLISQHEEVVGTVNLRDAYFKPSVILAKNFYDDISRGMCRQPAGKLDRNIDDYVKEFLGKKYSKYGSDLKAIDVQRGRDHGLGSYNDAREYCGLPRATTWTGFSDEIPQADIDRMRLVYKHPDDVELTVGGALERIVADAACGKTYQCIMAKQVYKSRVGDRFWFETSDPLLKFTRKQLKEIRKTSLARILCNNGRTITKMQRNVFKLPSDVNPIVGCNFIPKVNLRPWKTEKLSSEEI